MPNLIVRLREGITAFRSPEKRIDFNPTKQKPQAPPQKVSGIFATAPIPPSRKAGNYLSEAYQSWTYAAVQAISREVASVELKLRRAVKGELQDVEEHEALSLLHEANRFTTFYQLLEISQIYLELAGESFWVLLRPGNEPKGEILEIWPLRPDWFDVVDDDKEYIAGYRYRPPGLTEGIFFPRENVVHFKYPNPINPFRGKGSVEAAALAIDTDIFSAEWNRNFFFNSALPSTIFTTDQSLGEETVKRLKENWEQNFKGRSNAHKIGWLTAGFKPEKLSESRKDAEFLEQRRLVRDEILSVFGVPKSVVGVVDDVNRANAEASKAVFLENTIKPRIVRFISHLNEFYLRQFDNTEDLFFDFVDPAPTDVEADVRLIDSGKDSWMTINEARDIAGLEPISGGDTIYKPLNVLPTIGENPQPNPITQPKTEMVKLQGTGRKQKSIIPIPPKRLNQIRAEKKLAPVKTDFVKLMGFLLKNKTPKRYKEEITKKIVIEKKGSTPSGWTQEAKDRWWDQKISRTDPQEEVFKNKLKELFSQQEDRVLAGLNDIRYYTAEAKKSAVEKQFSVQEENKVFAGVLMPFIKEFMIDEGNFRLFQLGLNQAFDSATERAVRFIQKDGASFVTSKDGINTTTKEALKKTLAEGLANEESIPQLRNRVRSLYSEVSKRRADMIARTEVSRAANFGTMEAYIQSGIVERKEFLTARDERVCLWCNSLDGKTIDVTADFFKKGDSLTVDGKTLNFGLTDVGAPPLHVSCRCDLLPVI